MITALNIVMGIFVVWPALFAGYILGAMISGFKCGMWWQHTHENAAIDKICKKEKL